MSAIADRLPDRASRVTRLSGLDVRRATVAAGVVGGYMVLGLALRLSADAYLLLGIPITIAFQAAVARRPLRSLWLRAMPPLVFTPRSLVATTLVAVAPAALALNGLRGGDPVRTAYGIAGLVGAVGAVYAMRSMDRKALGATTRAAAIGSAAMVGVMVALRLATGGFNGDVVPALAAVVVSLATYLPVVFVMEEVLFRGALDPYLAGTDVRPGRASAVFGSALWGLWHLPVAGFSLGLATVPYFIGIHVLLGSLLVAAWRRTGNLAAPGIAHAVIDAVRNGVAVL
jgi:membrane protease YdiL (CAAX protease family)